jgi:hypothetical protein
LRSYRCHSDHRPSSLGRLTAFPPLRSIARRILSQRIASWSSLTQIFERNARRLEALSADASRFANALSSLAEAEESWKAPTRSTKIGGNGWAGAGEDESVLERDELGEGVRRGLGQAGSSWEQLAVDAEGRVSCRLPAEALSHRFLFADRCLGPDSRSR